jgi:hypothetical protein
MANQSGSDDQWPTYHDAPRNATFALGVISSTYPKLETGFAAVFANVCGVSAGFTWTLLPKIANHIRIALIEDMLERSDHGEEVIDRVRHFLKGFDALAFNRNMLMHSRITGGGATTSILLKTQNDGRGVACQVTLPELRAIADAMNVYHTFGIWIGNFISVKRDNTWITITGAAPGEPFPLPDKPPLPTRLEYTSDPIPFR